jgi:hypothetical protein
VLSKLEAMEKHLTSLDSSLSELRLQSDADSKAQAEQFKLLNTKLDTLLTEAHKQVFTYFVLVPSPKKGYLGKAISAAQPKHWFAKPMLLIPLYRAPNGELKRAPVATRQGGFEVLHPRDFVKAHPRAVQIAMLALQAGIKLGAAQIGVAIPGTLDTMSAVFDSLLLATLELSMEVIDAAADTAEQEATRMQKDPSAVLDRLHQDQRYREASYHEYALLKQWLDKQHPAWPRQSGLAPVVQADGTVAWQPENDREGQPEKHAAAPIAEESQGRELG